MARSLNPDSGRLDIRADPEQIRRWEAAAIAVNQNLSQWIRTALDSVERSQDRLIQRKRERKK